MLKRIINNLLSEFFPNTSNILHFGSSRYDDKYNDIDLLILSNKSSNFTKEIITYNKKSFELIIIPKQKVFEVLELDKLFGVYLSVIEEGEILIDKDGFFKNLKELISKKKLAPSPLLKKYFLENEIKNSLDSIKNEILLEERDLLFSDLINKLIDLRLIEFNITSSKKMKHRLTNIKKHDPKFLKNLIAVKKSYMSSVTYPILIQSLDCLIPIKNFLNRDFYSNQYILNSINKYSVLFLSKDLKDDFIIQHIFKLTKKYSKESFFYKIGQNDKSLMEKGWYIIFEGFQKENLKSFFNDLTKTLYQEGLQGNVILNFPYQLDIF